MHFFTIVSAAALAFASWSTAVPLAHDALPPNASSVVFSSCGGKGDTLKIKSITISPDPPVVGQSVSITVTGRLSRKLMRGTQMELVATVGGWQVKDKMYDLCTEMGIQCPIESTPDKDQTIVATLPVDSSIPPDVTIHAKMQATNPDDGSPAFCMEGDMTFAEGDGDINEAEDDAQSQDDEMQ